MAATLLTTHLNDDNEKDCMLCLERRNGLDLQSLILEAKLENRPATFPINIWNDRSWFIMCFRCFTELLKDRTPLAEEDKEGEVENNFDWDWNEPLTENNFDWNGPLTGIEEDVFWGVFREQSINEYLEELGQIILEELESHNFEDFEDFLGEFWDNAEFWSEVENQWTCEIAVNFLHDFQNFF